MRRTSAPLVGRPWFLSNASSAAQSSAGVCANADVAIRNPNIVMPRRIAGPRNFRLRLRARNEAPRFRRCNASAKPQAAGLAAAGGENDAVGLVVPHLVGAAVLVNLPLV